MTSYEKDNIDIPFACKYDCQRSDFKNKTRHAID